MAKTKSKIYLETSVISAYFDFKKQDQTRKDETRHFFKKILPLYQVFISEAVLAELGNTPKIKERQQFLKFSQPFKRLELTPRVIQLAQGYLDQQIVPQAKIFDAYHLAITTFNQIDFLVSWNYNHIANIAVEERVNAYNTLNNLAKIRIIFPSQLIYS